MMKNKAVLGFSKQVFGVVSKSIQVVLQTHQSKISFKFKIFEKLEDNVSRSSVGVSASYNTYTSTNLAYLNFMAPKPTNK
jgi:hypothetical protein